jgi:hypothetical protein
MNEVMVEKNIDMPVMRVTASKYPYDEMEVGDSFMVTSERVSMINTMCGVNKKKGVELGMKFIAKRVEGGVRVWRIS